MSAFKARPSELGYMSIEDEIKRLALLVCAAKRLAEACKNSGHEIGPQEIRMIEGVGYDIFYAAKHFSVTQKNFEAEIAELANQFLEDGTYAEENEAYKNENPERIQKLKEEYREQRKAVQEETDFIGNVTFSNTTKH